MWHPLCLLTVVCSPVSRRRPAWAFSLPPGVTVLLFDFQDATVNFLAAAAVAGAHLWLLGDYGVRG